MPIGHQRPEEIKRLLEEAKGHRRHPSRTASGPGSGGALNLAGQGVPIMDDGCDSGMIEEAIQEDLAQHPNSVSNTTRQFLQQHNH